MREAPGGGKAEGTDPGRPGKRKAEGTGREATLSPLAEGALGVLVHLFVSFALSRYYEFINLINLRI